MNWHSYQSYETIRNWLDCLVIHYSSRVTLFEIGRSSEGRPLKVVKISDLTQSSSQKPAVFIDGGIHARLVKLFHLDCCLVIAHVHALSTIIKPDTKVRIFGFQYWPMRRYDWKEILNQKNSRWIWVSISFILGLNYKYCGEKWVYINIEYSFMFKTYFVCQWTIRLQFLRQSRPGLEIFSRVTPLVNNKGMDSKKVQTSVQTNIRIYSNI